MPCLFSREIALHHANCFQEDLLVSWGLSNNSTVTYFDYHKLPGSLILDKVQNGAHPHIWTCQNCPEISELHNSGVPLEHVLLLLNVFSNFRTYQNC